MAEAVKQTAVRKSPLADMHANLGAALVEREDWLLPASYGDLLLEYAAVREGGAGLIDLSSRGRILVSGSEAVQFLNGLSTNDLKTLAIGQWMAAAFPNVQGRLIASVRIVRLDDEGTDKKVSPVFLIDTEAATHARVLKIIEPFTLAGDFHVTDMTSQTAMISVQGKKAAGIVGAVVGEAANEIAENGASQWAAAYGDLTVVRASHTGAPGFVLVVNADQSGKLWNALQTAGARPVGYDALELLRIEAGQPRYGVDMDETNVVTEVLDDAVSYTKGCYIGQEIIARIKYRGHVAKKLSGIMFQAWENIAAGDAVESAEGKEIGRVTSASYSYHLGRTIALTYLKYDYIAPDTKVTVVSGDRHRAGTVTALPFVK